MGKIIQLNTYTEIDTKGDKMYKEFLYNIRRKPNKAENMPERAKEVLTFFSIQSLSSGVPIVEILTKLGFQIYQSDLEPEGLSAYIAVDPKFEDVYGSNKITCVHIKDNVGHKKFALAHEMGHYLFDFDECKDLYYYNTYFPGKDQNDPKEKRANKFAANLLMPEKDFRQKFEEYKILQSKADIVNALEKYFVVSSTAVLRRFNELGIVGFENDMEI